MRLFNELNQKEVKMSEESTEVQVEAPRKLTSESVSTTMLKKMRQLTKNQLVDKLVDLNNYAENMKAANMLLLYKLNTLIKANQATNPTKEEQNEDS